jgi:hypothetical protein
VLFLIQAARLGMESRASVYGIRFAVWHHAVHVSLRLDAMQHFVLIPYATSSQFHTSLRDDLICSFLRCKKHFFIIRVLSPGK